MRRLRRLLRAAIRRLRRARSRVARRIAFTLVMTYARPLRAVSKPGKCKHKRLQVKNPDTGQWVSVCIKCGHVLKAR